MPLLPENSIHALAAELDAMYYYAVNTETKARVACFKSLDRAQKWMKRHQSSQYTILSHSEWHQKSARRLPSRKTTELEPAE
jgi:hypothetical protein